ncbi:MAG: hypothetical protein HFI88_03905 [Lachnospiraceae bacterium]|nr:hypothetical protein [Lachnospiraceae bacterium]
MTGVHTGQRIGDGIRRQEAYRAQNAYWVGQEPVNMGRVNRETDGDDVP